MKKTLLFFFGVFISSWSYSQSLSPEVIATAGDHFSSGEAQLSWTIGEPVIELFEAHGLILTQGFHQTNLLVTAVESVIANLSVKVFPNPVANHLTIDGQELPEDFRLDFTDAIGRPLQQQLLPSGSTIQMNLSSYPSGMYLLRLSSKKNQTTQTFKILKLK